VPEFSHGEEGWLGTFALERETREYMYSRPRRTTAREIRFVQQLV
jgi:hypothetical protein